jgi:hypothetical protein
MSGGTGTEVANLTRLRNSLTTETQSNGDLPSSLSRSSG